MYFYQRQTRVFVSVCLGVLACVTLAGCGSGHPSVTGVVTLDGAPTPNCFLTFESFDPGGSNATGRSDSEGRYNGYMSKNNRWVKEGEYRVEINSIADVAASNGDKVEAGALRIPSKYRGMKSELKITVEPGSNTIDFHLTSD